MANRYARTVGGNWTTDATWSTTSGGAADTVAPTASDDVFLDANSGNVTISATSVGKSLTCTGYTGTLTHNNFNLLISGSITFVSGMTYTANNSSAFLSMQSSGTLTTGGKLIRTFSIGGTNTTVTLGDNYNADAQKTCTLQMGALTGITLDMNGKSINGNSSTNRLLIMNQTLGTSRTITNATTSFTNADFRDITFSSASSLDLSAITGLSGDCGGNTITGGGSTLTFTTAATQTYTGGTDNWSSVAKWTSRVPLPQDDVSMSGVTGGTITADMPRLGKSIDWTGASGSPTWSVTTAPTLYGSLTLISGMTHTSAVAWVFEGRGSFTLTSAGKTLTSGSTSISMVGGTLTLQDALTQTGSSTTMAFTDGTFVANGFNLSAPVFGDGFVGRTKAINMGTGTWTSTGSQTTIWNFQQGGLTVTPGTSTIFLTASNGGTNTFAGGGKTYNDLKIGGGGTSIIALIGANTFNRIYTDGGGTKTITFPAGSTTTLSYSGTDNFNNGTNVITINSSSGGSAATLSKPLGRFEGNYLSIQDSTATGTFYAGENSTNVSGNSGWLFRSYSPNQSQGLMCWLDAIGAGTVFIDRLTKTVYTNSNVTRGIAVASGVSMVFNGTNAKLTLGNIGTIYSASFWIKTDSTTEEWIDFNGTQAIQISSGTIAATSWTSPTIYVNGAVTTTLGANVWAHIAVVSSTAVNASAVVLGLIGAGYGAFSMTNIKLYDRQLSAIEVGSQYNRDKNTP